MGQENDKDRSHKPTPWRDARLYQIASLSTLLLYGLLWLHFDVSPWQITITLGTALLTQYAGSRFFNLPRSTPRAP